MAVAPRAARSRSATRRRSTAAGTGSGVRSTRSICWRRVERPPARMRVFASVALPRHALDAPHVDPAGAQRGEEPSPERVAPHQPHGAHLDAERGQVLGGVAGPAGLRARSARSGR